MKGSSGASSGTSVMPCAVLVQEGLADEEGGASATELDAAKDIRNGALRMLAEVWQRFPGACDYSHAWAPFVELAQPLLERTSIEVSDRIATC